MPADAGFLAFLKEQMAAFGPVTARGMFGGAGIYRDGVMFALLADETLYFKADDISKPAFEAEGLDCFTYVAGDGRTTVMSYRRAPERCLDDPDEMAKWCREAYGSALRSRQPARGPRAR